MERTTRFQHVALSKRIKCVWIEFIKEVLKHCRLVSGQIQAKQQGTQES